MPITFGPATLETIDFTRLQKKIQLAYNCSRENQAIC